MRQILQSLGLAPFPEIAPDGPLAVIGDIHGCVDLLRKALEAAKGYGIVCVGDYMDRGPASAEVLELLTDRPDVTCLSGNHEEMLLGFLDSPGTQGPRWLAHGGDDTLKSFGIAARDPGRASLDLSRKLGPSKMAWLRGLPTHVVSGNVAITHAGADPRTAVNGQPRDNFHWGHKDFYRKTRRDGLWVVHGHSIVPEAKAQSGRIAIDTGAYATGRLSIAFLERGQISFTEID